jgi:hypothetical protein
MYGNFSGGFNVTGIFQEFTASEGQEWRLSSKSRHFGGDPMLGGGPPFANWVVQKIAFFDAAGTEICAAETVILDGTFATDVWHENAEAVGYAPPGTVKMQALILYLQPSFDGGAAFVDNIELTMQEPVPDLNLLANPGFEAGLAGWTTFGNAYPEASNPPQFVPIGCGLVSMFGNFTGGFNVSGIFQEFPTVEGFEWTISSLSRHFSGDAMVGTGPDQDNWVVQKIAFFDAGNNEIGGADAIILDGTFATDVWHDNAPIVGVAPAGTVKMQALILYLQPLWAGGAAHIDNVKLTALPVALLGEASFDVNDVDVSSLLLEGVAPVQSSIEDESTLDCATEDSDGYDDLTLRFDKASIVEALGEVSDGDIVELTVTGSLLDGTPIVGTDCVRIIAKGPVRNSVHAASLGPATPNPFNPVTRISYYVPNESLVKLSVFDVKGRLLKSLVSGVQPMGEHMVQWDASGVASGIYFYRLEVGSFVQTRKMVLLK